MNSPWWYRGRTWVFALLYFAGFFIGGMVSKRTSGAPEWILSVACICAAICYGWRVWGSSYLRAGMVWNPGARSDQLIIAGPFRFLRHPLYFGNFFLALGIGLLAPIPGFIFIVFSNVLFVIALARHEEAILQSTYGDRYIRYEKRVPALFPLLRPVAQEGTAHASLAQGLLAEVLTGALLLGLILATIDRRHGVIDFFALYSAGIIAQLVIARVQSPERNPI